MAAILEQSAVCDGYDVACLLASGERLTFHFAAAPADVQVSVDALEVEYLAYLVSQQVPLLEIVEL